MKIMRYDVYHPSKVVIERKFGADDRRFKMNVKDRF